MNLGTRKVVDRAFSGLGVTSIVLLAAALVVILAPMVLRGTGAFVFRGTVEFRRLEFEKFGRGNPDRLKAEQAAAIRARKTVYDMLKVFPREIEQREDAFRAEKRELRKKRRAARDADVAEQPERKAALDRREKEFDGRRERLDRQKADFEEVHKLVGELLGPPPGEELHAVWDKQYGQTRWDGVEKKVVLLTKIDQWVQPDDPQQPNYLVRTPRAKLYEGTALAGLFDYVEDHAEEMFLPKWTFYWRFLTDTSDSAHYFGGIWPEILGTIYLTLGSMVFAVPMGVIAAVYLVEYAKEGPTIRVLRTFTNTLAGVPSIVFGLFGAVFFIRTLHLSEGKSVLVGSLTLALLVLPMIIRAAEEAIRAVPRTYKEAALSVGAGKWRTVVTVILPAALPGILTGIVISMGRAAGETAPIIFTAAVSVGQPLNLGQVFNHPTPALPWNIYNLCTEHRAVDEIRHVQYGMVLTLVAIVLLLNLAAIVMRARISRKMRS
ncbi:MAG TPA: phosphate ABC transporter permease PstA [Thermoguttaceae bacterium]|nr:phosphate ABC transporter permease PstA [Thermoguttaceae bacterium]